MSLLQQRGGEIQAQRIRDALDNGENIDLYRVRILGDLSSSDEETERAENSFSEPKHIKRIPINVMSMVPIMESVNILTFSL